MRALKALTCAGSFRRKNPSSVSFTARRKSIALGTGSEFLVTFHFSTEMQRLTISPRASTFSFNQVNTSTDVCSSRFIGSTASPPVATSAFCKSPTDRMVSRDCTVNFGPDSSQANKSFLKRSPNRAAKHPVTAVFIPGEFAMYRSRCAENESAAAAVDCAIEYSAIHVVSVVSFRLEFSIAAALKRSYSAHADFWQASRITLAPSSFSICAALKVISTMMSNTSASICVTL